MSPHVKPPAIRPDSSTMLTFCPLSVSLLPFLTCRTLTWSGQRAPSQIEAMYIAPSTACITPRYKPGSCCKRMHIYYFFYPNPTSPREPLTGLCGHLNLTILLYLLHALQSHLPFQATPVLQKPSKLDYMNRTAHIQKIANKLLSKNQKSSAQSNRSRFQHKCAVTHRIVNQKVMRCQNAALLSKKRQTKPFILGRMLLASKIKLV